MIAVTPSGGWLQSSPTIPELGFCLGTRLQMMWLDAASPAALRAGARPRTTLTPTLVLRGGRAEMALGTPGGDQQEQWQLPVLLRMIVGGYTAQQAIDAPSLHTTALVDSFWPRGWTAAGVVVEDRLGAEVIAGLERRGHDVVRSGDWSLGRVSAVGPRCRDRTASGPPPTRAACRATPPAADHPALRSGARRNSATSGASPAPTSSAGRLRPFTSNEWPPPSIHAIVASWHERDGLLELRVRIDERVVRPLDEQLRLGHCRQVRRRAPWTGRRAGCSG